MLDSELEKTLRADFPFGFHLSRDTWERHDVATLIDPADPEAAATLGAVRRLADRINTHHRTTSRIIDPMQSGHLVTVGVIVDILRYVVARYSRDQLPGVVIRGLDWTHERQGPAVVQQPPPSFVHHFPPSAVSRGGQSDSEYLDRDTPTGAGRETTAREMILLTLATANPAFRPFRELFDDEGLKRHAPYETLVHSLEGFFEQQPAVEPLGMSLFDCLRAPMRAAPDSLDGQLEYIRENWAHFLPGGLLRQLLLAADILKEEERLRGLGPGPVVPLEFRYGRLEHDEHEPERFSHDADWMSNVVLIAKSTHVWLDQLSKRYKRHIRHLSDIPDEELDRLARWGFTGLWLIGLWERSPASQRVKQMMGNPDAVASAYSLNDYVIAADLGGPEAYNNLRERAAQRGIRLASDMVPNHVGIDSRWLIEHPEWFVQTGTPPYPCYQFSGADLCADERVGVYIEDGYWDHRDAAVVFKRHDHWTGDTRYIYHGNDGTNMPWNDTAQLNFLLPDVREAVIQTILHVARQFPIIRFDAAMTLAKRHYQRLWYPHPGDGGAIPSRAEHGMTRADFDAAFPAEFWRDVVDRVAAEVPDTLLLAEAFWLMEGYFVRTLGMHRVYNSAFMNMLKMEDNAKYRTTIRNVLTFSPEILKRFVNFMNNPDERTAVDQFGKGDKYFGVVMMLVTMPGLPMVGHGQIEGFTEKYGMEYRRAYWDEQVDDEMVRRHEREIFPLMRRRALFSGAANFALYDFVTPEGHVDENVFAYSNRAGDERALILYNNAYSTTSGRIHWSTEINTGSADAPQLATRSLVDTLGLNPNDGVYHAFRDHRTGLQYLRSGQQLAADGLHADLQGYQYHAFVDFREIHDTDGSWGELAQRLNGAGVPNIDDAYREMRAEPVLAPFRTLVSEQTLVAITGDPVNLQVSVIETAARLFAATRDFVGSSERIADLETALIDECRTLSELIRREEALTDDPTSEDNGHRLLDTPISADAHILLAWIAIRQMGRIAHPEDLADDRARATARLHDWCLIKAAADAFGEVRENAHEGCHDALFAAALVAHDDLLDRANAPDGAEALRSAFDDDRLQQCLGFNTHDDAIWLNREALHRLLDLLGTAAAIRQDTAEPAESTSRMTARETARRIADAAERTGYRVDQLIGEFADDTATPSAENRRSARRGGSWS